MRNAFILAAVMTAAVTLAPLAALAQASPNYPPKTTVNNPGPPTAPSSEKCEDDMGHLRQVFAAQINRMDEDWKVAIYPICEGTHTVALKSQGNATHLRGTVGRNEALLAARMKAFRILFSSR